MKKKISIFGLVFLLLAGGIHAQQRILSESDIVQVEPEKKLYHRGSCTHMETSHYGLTLGLALERGYKPCPYCIPVPKKEESKPSPVKETLGKVIKKSLEQQNASNAQAGFREATWGMNLEQVKQLEKGVTFQKDKGKTSGLDVYAYPGNVGDDDCIIAYYFAENKLVGGRYIFTEEHMNSNLFLEDFTVTKAALAEKYGPPNEDNTVWKNDLFKDDPDDWGTAISSGQLVLEVIWDLSKTNITHQLFGDNFNITHWVDYKSKITEHIKLMKAAMEKAKKVIW